MTLGRPSRSHATTIILVLGLAVLLVGSVSATVLWYAYQSHGRRVDPGRRELPDGRKASGTHGGGPRSAGGGTPGGPRGNAGRSGTANDGAAHHPADGHGGTRSPVNCGDVEAWDSDGDGISDSTEDSNRPFHSFDPATCDRDPSSASGTPAAGVLVGGINLTDQGHGYLHLRGSDAPDTDDWGTLRLISCIEAVGRDAEPMDVKVTINDMSHRNGGLFVPHSSHENGLDVDVRYVRRDGRVAPLDIRSAPNEYDPVTTQALMQLFLHRCNVTVIFTDLPSVQFTNEELDRPVLVQAPGHTNHFHVRVRPPS